MKLTSYIKSYECPQEPVEGAIKLFEMCKDMDFVVPGKIGMGDVDKAIKDSEDVYVESLPIGEDILRYEFGMDDYVKHINEACQDYLDSVHLGYYQMRMLGLPQIQHYSPGGGYFQEHIDSYSNSTCNRIIGYITYLNTVDNGGGTQFPYMNHTEQAVSGKTIFFPSGVTHIHKGVVAPDEDKYILVGWFGSSC